MVFTALSSRLRLGGSTRKRVFLPRRSLQIVTKESRYDWTHAIPLECFHDDERVSLTFRKQGSKDRFQVGKAKNDKYSLWFFLPVCKGVLWTLLHLPERGLNLHFPWWKTSAGMCGVNCKYLKKNLITYYIKLNYLKIRELFLYIYKMCIWWVV